MCHKISGVNRAKKLDKKKKAWKGGGFAAQQKRMEINNFYARESRERGPKITISVKKKGRK